MSRVWEATAGTRMQIRVILIFAGAGEIWGIKKGRGSVRLTITGQWRKWSSNIGHAVARLASVS